MTAAQAFRRLAKGSTSRWLAAPVLLASNWLFQGMFIMDATERWTKLLLDVLLAGVAFLVLARFAPALGPAVQGLFAALVAHTANWLANGQLPVVLKNLGLTRLPPERMRRELARLRVRAHGAPALVGAYAYGSLARGEAHDRSDLDVRVLRRPGAVAGLRAVWFVLWERSRATLLVLPLDIYVADRRESLGKVIAPDEIERPVVLMDRTAVPSKEAGP